MTTYKQGDVVLVPVPFTDQTSSKKRPALVVSANWYNQNRPDVILAPITSTVRDPQAREEWLIRGNEFRRAGLYKESVIKCGSVLTVRQNLILRKLGMLPTGSVKQVHAHIVDVLTGKHES